MVQCEECDFDERINKSILSASHECGPPGLQAGYGAAGLTAVQV